MSSLYISPVEDTTSLCSDRPHSRSGTPTLRNRSRQGRRMYQRTQSMSHVKHKVEIVGEPQQEMGDRVYRVRPRNNSLPDITTIMETDSDFWCRKPSCKRYSLQRSQSVEWDPISALFTAITEDDTTELERILTEFEVDLNCLSLAGVSPLHTAALVGGAKAIKVLLEFGAEVDFLDDSGRTTLEIALLAGNFDCASLLINAGASMRNIVDGIRIY